MSKTVHGTCFMRHLSVMAICSFSAVPLVVCPSVGHVHSTVTARDTHLPLDIQRDSDTLGCSSIHRLLVFGALHDGRDVGGAASAAHAHWMQTRDGGIYNPIFS